MHARTKCVHSYDTASDTSKSACFKPEIRTYISWVHEYPGLENHTVEIWRKCYIFHACLIQCF